MGTQFPEWVTWIPEKITWFHKSVTTFLSCKIELSGKDTSGGP